MTEQLIETFRYFESPIRVICVERDPWWALVDVCAILELRNPTMVAKSLDDDERAKFDLGRQGETWFVNEPGLYEMIIRSDKPDAKKFRRWITHEVIPSIRKQGFYSAMSHKGKSYYHTMIYDRRVIMENGEAYVSVDDLPNGKAFTWVKRAVEKERYEERREREQLLLTEQTKALRKEIERDFPYTYEYVDARYGGDVAWLIYNMKARAKEDLMRKFNGAEYFSEAFLKAADDIVDKIYG